MFGMKKIQTQGIINIEPLDGSQEWYWGTDYACGDLYEAEELFQQGHPIKQNKLIFIHYPDGKVVQPMAAKEGQYFGAPICHEDKIIILMVDFPAEKIKLVQFDHMLAHFSPLVDIPLSNVEDCYNLMLAGSPLMLIRQGSDNQFQILWPESAAFEIGNTEGFLFRIGDELYFSEWKEDPDYREEIIVRKMDTGEIVNKIPGTMMVMPDGQMWVLT